MAKRIQRSRKRNWRKPEGVICCTRPGPWGNPFGSVPEFRAWLVDGQFPRVVNVAAELAERRAWMLANLETLRGKDLACWCGLNEPCHVDVLLEVANGK